MSFNRGQFFTKVLENGIKFFFTCQNTSLLFLCKIRSDFLKDLIIDTNLNNCLMIVLSEFYENIWKLLFLYLWSRFLWDAHGNSSRWLKYRCKRSKESPFGLLLQASTWRNPYPSKQNFKYPPHAFHWWKTYWRPFCIARPNIYYTFWCP